jgi:ATP-dependent HslUV protease ATP-binding subunit HslU
MLETLTPRQIVDELDKYIIGQREAKKSVAIALRNRWRRMNAPEPMRDEIVPNNIILIGPTGVGKTEIARRLARLAGAPFIKVEATKFTEVGYVGRDVDSMVRDLTDISVGLVRDEQSVRVQEKARQQAEERILDVLIPPSRPRRPTTHPQDDDPGGVVNGPGFVIQPAQETAETDDDLRERTRERFRGMIRSGSLDEREVEIDVVSDASPTLQMFGPMGMEEMGLNIQELFGNMGPKKRKRRRMTVAEALDVLTHEEAEKLIDMDAVQKDAIERVQQAGIVFIDEIDKVAGGGSREGGPDVSREGVQRDLLPIVEGSNVMTKYGMVRTDHILFIASGAFHVAKPSDLIPELQGRFPIRVELTNLTEEDFFQILTVPKNALLKQYQALLASDGVEITFTDEAVREIARIAAHVNEEVENIGARRLHTILTTLLEEILFEVPGDISDRQIEITADYVHERLHSVVQNRDLSQYIL